jgi:hypothetical protein
LNHGRLYSCQKNERKRLVPNDASCLDGMACTADI